MILVAVTVVGIPAAIIGLLSWLVLIYIAKIIAASYIGNLMLESSGWSDSLFATLGAGLLVVIVAINIIKR